MVGGNGRTLGEAAIVRPRRGELLLEGLVDVLARMACGPGGKEPPVVDLVEKPLHGNWPCERPVSRV
jgi:hypothetical protein